MENIGNAAFEIEVQILEEDLVTELSPVAAAIYRLCGAVVDVWGARVEMPGPDGDRLWFFQNLEMPIQAPVTATLYRNTLHYTAIRALGLPLDTEIPAR